ncbi:hypothetical protein MATL_G00226930 [Megalops atlanticus]|uniref:Protein Jade-1 n=1 Tax=Megalops atlanticus TaxID=7932 RepID=A0A9D3SYZ6_MEGAT|nr:hypothetical protein MATL_G00226930 [Megalops atlanticus]
MHLLATQKHRRHGHTVLSHATEMKRGRDLSSCEDSDDGSNTDTLSQHYTSQLRRSSWSRMEGRKPSEVFRTDFITAMKLHDSVQLSPEDYYLLADPWRQEWEKGVQVPVSPGSLPQPVVRTVVEQGKEIMFIRPKKLIRCSGSEPPALGYVDLCTLAEGVCRYDLNEWDEVWLQLANEEFREMGMQVLDEFTMERVMEEFEHNCYDNMNHAMETEEGLGIEYDEDVVCDVCHSPEGEDGNEMVFCDKCNICVHQACYGILKVPEGSWLCRICALGVLPKCLLCPKTGGAMKPTRSGTKWAHVSCALWIPEVSIGNPEKMEPIMNVSHIPSNRWALLCCLCKEKTGACIQCSAKNCRTAFHVTCALDHNLKMNTILTESDEVKFKSFCPKHSVREGRPAGGQMEEEEKEKGKDEDGKTPKNGELPCTFAPCLDPSAVLGVNQQEAQMLSLRKLKLQQLEDEFFKFVTVEEVAHHLQLPEETVDFLYQYWKLKRKANFNRPLLTPKKDEEDDLAKREQEVLLCRLKLFTHLRQDLERVRNLTYMVTRREKIKRAVCRIQEQIFHHHVKLLEEDCLSGVLSAPCLEDTLLLSWVSSLVSSPRLLKGDPGRQAGQDPHRRERGAENWKKKLHKSSNIVSDSRNPSTCSEEGRKARKGDGLTPPAVKAASHKVEPEFPRRRNGDQDEDRRSGLREKASHFKAKQGLLKSSMEGVLRQPGVQVGHDSRMSVDFVPKCSSSLRRLRTPSGPLKNWGSFRIPKKSERQTGSPCRPLEVGMPKAQPGGPESNVPITRRYGTDIIRRRHAHQLGGHSPITRRYSTNIICRGIMAS